jgi:hypothetical protein
MARQDQRISDSDIVIQSGRDTTLIKQDVTPVIIEQIVSALAQQLPAYAKIAREIVDARLDEFNRSLLRRFAHLDLANPNAFKDPDFLYAVTRAQHGYARSGEKEIGDILIDLISERSRVNSRDRLSLTLDAAVETASTLTLNEFAALSVVFFLRYASVMYAGNIEWLARYFSKNLDPFVNDISREASSYYYIESQQCGTIGSSPWRLEDLLKTKFAGTFSRGFTWEDVEQCFFQNHLAGDTDPIDELVIRQELEQFVIPCFNNTHKLQFNVANEVALKFYLANCPFSDIDKTSILELVSRNIDFDYKRAIDQICEIYPIFSTIGVLWENTPLQNLTLTARGIAIGHANLCRAGGEVLDLGNWIK